MTYCDVCLAVLKSITDAAIFPALRQWQRTKMFLSPTKLFSPSIILNITPA
jgi:hypothetical protein